LNTESRFKRKLLIKILEKDKNGKCGQIVPNLSANAFTPTYLSTVNASIDLGEVGKGVSKARRYDCDDGETYVVKFVDATKTSVNEYVAAILATSIGLPVPKMSLVHIPQQLLELSNLQVTGQLHIGVIFLKYAVDFDKFDLKVLEEVKLQNHDRLPGVRCFDNWVINRDRCNNGNNLIEIKGNDAWYYVIDFGHCFVSPNWCINILKETVNMLDAVPVFEPLKRYMNDKKGCVGWAVKIKNVTDEIICKLVHSIPDSWSNVNGSEREELSFFINTRKRLIEQIVNSNIY
jgi:HipA-like kinase